MVMMWSAPATDNMFATSFADMGARLWGTMILEKQIYQNLHNWDLFQGLFNKVLDTIFQNLECNIIK